MTEATAPRPPQQRQARPPCLLCGRPLQVVGTARKNGVQRHGDWQSRAYHKQCWAQLHPRAHSSWRPAFKAGRGGGRGGGRRGKGRRASGSNYV